MNDTEPKTGAKFAAFVLLYQLFDGKCCTTVSPHSELPPQMIVVATAGVVATIVGAGTGTHVFCEAGTCLSERFMRVNLPCCQNYIRRESMFFRSGILMLAHLNQA